MIGASTVIESRRVVDVAVASTLLASREPAAAVAEPQPAGEIGRNASSLPAVAEHGAGDGVGEDGPDRWHMRREPSGGLEVDRTVPVERRRPFAVPEEGQRRDREVHGGPNRTEVADLRRHGRLGTTEEQRDGGVGLPLRFRAPVAGASRADACADAGPDRDRLLGGAEQVDPGHAVGRGLDDEPSVLEGTTLPRDGRRGRVPVLEAAQRLAERDRRHAARLLERLLLEFVHALRRDDSHGIDEVAHLLQRHLARGHRRRRGGQPGRQRDGVMHVPDRGALVHPEGRGELRRAGTIGPFPVLTNGARGMLLDLAHRHAQFVHPAQLLGLRGTDRTLEPGDVLERRIQSGGRFHVSIRPRPSDTGKAPLIWCFPCGEHRRAMTWGGRVARRRARAEDESRALRPGTAVDSVSPLSPAGAP